MVRADRIGPVLVVGEESHDVAALLKAEGISLPAPVADIVRAVRRRPGLLVLSGGRLGTSDVDALRRYLADGGDLIAERPCDRLLGLLGLRPTKQEGWSRVEIRADGPPQAVQVLGREQYPGTARGEGPVVHTAAGPGHAVIVPFDIASSVRALTQGRTFPTKNIVGGVPRVDMGRVADADLTHVPQADLLGSWLASLVESSLPHPLPRIWYYPAGASGGLCVTHDTDNVGSAAIAEVNRIDRDMGVEATTFMRVFDADGAFVRGRIAPDGDVQFHPVLPYMHHPAQRAALLQRELTALRPYRTVENLFVRMQKGLLEGLMQRRFAGSRNHGLLWRGPRELVRQLAFTGARFDSTLGSNVTIGYPFAAGRPYRLASDGEVSGREILEFPLHMMDHALWVRHGSCAAQGPQLTEVSDLIERAFGLYHSLLVIDFHHYYLLAEAPERSSLNMYRELIERAKAKAAAVRTMSWWDRYWRARLSARTEIEGWDARKGLLDYRVRAGEDLDDVHFTHTVPSVYDGRQVQKVVVNGSSKKFTIKELWGAKRVLFELPGGEHSLRMLYR